MAGLVPARAPPDARLRDHSGVAALTPRVEAWRRAGRDCVVAGRRIHVHRRRRPGPLVVLLHGFPSSSYDWRGVLERRPDWNALAFDFLGFGLSEKPVDHVYSLSGQADLVELLVEDADAEDVVLVAHDMGTSVATELMARELRGEGRVRLDAALLFNGNILLDRASLTLGQKLLRGHGAPLFASLTNEYAFRRQFARLFPPDHPLPDDEAADQWSLVAHDRGHKIMHRLIHYLDERERLTERWHGAFRDWPHPLELAWGLKDPVATTRGLEGLRELRDCPVTELPELGHYPQLDDPEAIAAAADHVLAVRGG
jgi:pimeloyl-ACP methyl ester carboxylesterase